jgi:hypothetical protein
MKITQFILTDYFTISDAAGGEVCRFKPKFHKTFGRRSVSQTIETAKVAVSIVCEIKNRPIIGGRRARVRHQKIAGRLSGGGYFTLLTSHRLILRT